MPGMDGSFVTWIATLIAGIIALLFTAFWIWMLVDCAKNEPGGTEKIVWVLIILFAHLLGALIYFVVRRPTRIREIGR